MRYLNYTHWNENKLGIRLKVLAGLFYGRFVLFE
jgi:hypothetical protein